MNRDVTFKDIRTKFSGIFRCLMFSISCWLFLILCLGVGIICCTCFKIIEAKKLLGLLMVDIIGLKGVLGLWILGSPYPLGSCVSVSVSERSWNFI